MASRAPSSWPSPAAQPAAPVSCAPGGSKADAPPSFLASLYDQIHVGGAVGNATGRNIHMRSLDEAVRLTPGHSAITLGDYDVEEAMDVFEGKEHFTI